MIRPKASDPSPSAPRVAVIQIAFLAVMLSACAYGSTSVAPSEVRSAFPSIEPLSPAPSSHLVQPRAASESQTPSPRDTGYGISEEQAIQISRQNVTSDSEFVSAAHGRFADVYQNPMLRDSSPVEPDQQVWAVFFQSLYTICPPDGSQCLTPRPGFTTVILDYSTGERLATISYSPEPT